MRTTITVRLDPEIRNGLEERARSLGKTKSEIVREILRQVVTERPISTRAGHVRGRLALEPLVRGSWRAGIKERNWRE